MTTGKWDKHIHDGYLQIRPEDLDPSWLDADQPAYVPLGTRSSKYTYGWANHVYYVFYRTYGGTVKALRVTAKDELDAFTQSLPTLQRLRSAADSIRRSRGITT